MQPTRKAAPSVGLATLAALALVAAAPHAARAQSFGYTFTGGGSIGTASGSLAATPAAGPDAFGNTHYFQANSGGGQFTSGQFAGDALTLFANPNPGSESGTASYSYDDELFPNQPSMSVDNGGLIFTFTDAGLHGAQAGNYVLNVYSTGGNYDVDYYTADVNHLGGVGSFALTTPEPASVAAFAFTGLGAAGLILKARRRRTVA